MNPIHPVSFPTVLNTFLNGPERQPGREENSLSNVPPTQREQSTQAIQVAATHVGVPERKADTGQTGSNVPGQPAANGSDSLTALSSVPFTELQSSTNQELLALAQEFQNTDTIGSIMSDLQVTAKEVQSGVELVGQATTAIYELIQLIKQISKDSEAIDQLLEYIGSSSTGQTGGVVQVSQQSSQISFRESIAQVIAQAQQEQAQALAKETIAYTQQYEIALTSTINEQGEEEPERVLRVQLNGAEVVHTEVITVRRSDPLVLDLDGDGIELSHVKDGVMFDIDADGVKDQTAFVTGGDAFLALDRNANGSIDDGSELFGDQNGAIDGFEELRKYDSNEDGVINREDDVFDKLRLFSDDNRDGLTQLDEIHTLQQKRIEAILLDSAHDVDYDVNENPIIKAGSYVLKDGSEHRLADALLNYAS